MLEVKVQYKNLEGYQLEQLRETVINILFQTEDEYKDEETILYRMENSTLYMNVESGYIYPSF